MNTDRRDITKKLVIILALGLLLRLILAPIWEGFDGDMDCFRDWANAASSDLLHVYNTIPDLDYPPVYIYVLFIVGKVVKFTGASSVMWLHNLIVKLPSIFTDVATAFMIFKVCEKRIKPEYSLIAAAAYVFNPAVFFNSAIWGQIDSFLTMLVLAALLMLSENRIKASAVLFAVALVTKPQALFFFPILFFELARRKRLRYFIEALVTGFLTCMALFLPYMILYKNPFWYIDLYLTIANHYTGASVHAYNLFALLGGDLVSDSAVMFIFSYRVWGIILTALLILLTAYLYYISRGKDILFPASLVMVTGIFILSARMHERYMFPAIAVSLLALVYTGERRMRFLFAGYSVVIFFNELIVLVCSNLQQYREDWIGPFNVTLYIFSFINVALFVYLIYTAYNLVSGRKGFNRQLFRSIS